MGIFHPVYMCYVDLEKTYHCVLRESCWGTVEILGVPG